MKYRTPLIVTVLLAMSVTGYANEPAAPKANVPKAGIKFPSDRSSRSPDGRWSLRFKCSDADDSRHLLLAGIGGMSRVLRSFDRACDALWSADSSHIAVTDWLSSSDSDIFIYSVADPSAGLSVSSLLPEGLLEEAELSGHCYFEGLKWLDNQRLKIRIFGHTDALPSHNFEYVYAFDLSTKEFEKMKDANAGAEQPAAKPADKVPEEVPPPTPASKDASE